MNRKKKGRFLDLLLFVPLALVITLSADSSVIFLPLVMNGPENTATPSVTATPTSTTTATSYKQTGGSATLAHQAFVAGATDESGVWVTSSGVLTLTDSTISTTGNTSSQDNSSFYGLNAALLASAAGKITVADGAITSSGTGANGAFATGSGSAVTLTNVTLKASGNGGHGVMVTQGGAMTLSSVDMSTSGANAGAIATDRGGGTISVTGGTVSTSGQDSPGIYSTGAITVNGATISASGAEAAVIEGANTITLHNTTLSSSKTGKWGVMIYQSMSGDAEGTQGTFTMLGGALVYTSASGPLFYVTNSTGVIHLSGVSVSAGSGTLLKAAAGSWGTSGSNGGTAFLSASAQTLSGNMVADSSSAISVTLQSGSALAGAINADNQAKAVNLTLDATSAWTVTADSYLTCLSDAAGISGTSISNINGNGYTVYYDAGACTALGNKTYTLNGGGTLKPAS